MARVDEVKFSIELPYPPSVNTIWRHSRGRFHLSPNARKYREQVHVCVLRALTPGQRRFLPLFRVPVKVEAAILFPDRRVRDLDNVEKALWDSLEHAGVLESDALIQAKQVYRAGVEAPGSVVVTIEAFFSEEVDRPD